MLFQRNGPPDLGILDFWLGHLCPYSEPGIFYSKQSPWFVPTTREQRFSAREAPLLRARWQFSFHLDCGLIPSQDHVLYHSLELLMEWHLLFLSALTFILELNLAGKETLEWGREDCQNQSNAKKEFSVMWRLKFSWAQALAKGSRPWERTPICCWE